MQHKLRLSKQEKMRACLDLSDFIFKANKKFLNIAKFNQKLRHLRLRHLSENISLLENLGKTKSE